MRQCPNCKTNNPDDARFCNYCGMRLPESKEETLYSDLDELEEAPKTEFSDQEIEEESEKVIDEDVRNMLFIDTPYWLASRYFITSSERGILLFT